MIVQNSCCTSVSEIISLYPGRVPFRELPSPDLPELSALWRSRWPDSPPIAHQLHFDRDLWVRFHSLPGSKRYADTAAEYQILLDRYNTVLTELFAGHPVYIVTTSFVPDEGIEVWSPTDPHALNPGSRPWTRLREDDDADPGGTMHLHVSEQRWKPRILDPLLRAVADDECAGVIIMDTDLRRLYLPYDGGADVILASPQERDALKNSHANWLSTHPLGR